MDLLGFKAEIEAAEQDAARWPRITNVLGIVKGWHAIRVLCAC